MADKVFVFHFISAIISWSFASASRDSIAYQAIQLYGCGMHHRMRTSHMQIHTLHIFVHLQYRACSNDYNNNNKYIKAEKKREREENEKDE